MKPWLNWVTGEGLVGHDLDGDSIMLSPCLGATSALMVSVSENSAEPSRVMLRRVEIAELRDALTRWLETGLVQQ